MTALLWLAVSSEEQAGDDKASLTEQKRVLRAAAERDGRPISDVLIIPGFSRAALSWDEFETSAAEAGHDAPRRMSAHWKRRDFTAIYAYDVTRLGRSQALIAYFIERTIKGGGVIVTHLEGVIDQQNYRIAIAMYGFGSASENDKRKEKMKYGKIRLAERGLNLQASELFTHLVIRDKRGNKDTLIVDESKRRLWSDLLTALCGDEQHPPAAWRTLEQTLYDRFGHAAPDGKPYPMYKFKHLVNSPFFWGHTAYGYTAHNHVVKRPWLYNAAVPPPPGVLFYPNTTGSVFTGEERERLIAELMRRDRLTGRARPQSTYTFSTLVRCDHCGRNMAYALLRPGAVYYRCNKKSKTGLDRYSGLICDSNRIIPERDLIEFMNDVLSRLLAGLSPELFRPNAPSKAAVLARVETIEREIEAVEATLAGLFLQRATAPNNTIGILERQINAKSQELQRLETARFEAQRQVTRADDSGQIRAAALEQLRALTLPRFWALSSVERNQLLSRLMGRFRINVRDGQVIGFFEVSPR